MKLDMNCVRDILLFLESVPYFITDESGDVEACGCWFNSICENLPDYPKETLYYSLSKLEEGGYIDMSTLWAGDCLNECCVNFITLSGHEFLESIRDNDRWKKIKSGMAVVRNYSLSAISAIAEGVTSAAISSYLKTP